MPDETWLDLPTSTGFWWIIQTWRKDEDKRIECAEVTERNGELLYMIVGCEDEDKVDYNHGKWLKAKVPEMPFEIKLLQATPNQ